MLMLIRELSIGDLPAATIIEAGAAVYPWAPAILSNAFHIGNYHKLLCVDETPVAFVMATIKAGECHILNLCVAKDSQGRGYASSLLTQLIKDLSSEQIDSLYLEVRESNLPARNLYKKFGFEEIGVRKEYYSTEGDRENAIVCRLG